MRLPWEKKDGDKMIAELSDPADLKAENDRLSRLVAQTRSELTRTLKRLNQDFDLNKGKPRGKNI